MSRVTAYHHGSTRLGLVGMVGVALEVVAKPGVEARRRTRLSRRATVPLCSTEVGELTHAVVLMLHQRVEALLRFLARDLVQWTLGDTGAHGM